MRVGPAETGFERAAQNHRLHATGCSSMGVGWKAGKASSYPSNAGQRKKLTAYLGAPFNQTPLSQKNRLPMGLGPVLIKLDGGHCLHLVDGYFGGAGQRSQSLRAAQGQLVGVKGVVCFTGY